MSKFWTKERVNLLFELTNDGLSIPEIARRLGTTKDTVRGRIRRKHIHRTINNLYGPFWTKERVNLLFDMADDGLKASEIARRLGTTKNAVIGKIHRVDGSLLNRPTTTMKERLDALDRLRPAGACAWPIGDEVKNSDFHFCRKPVALFSKSYCENHHPMVWVKPKIYDKVIRNYFSLRSWMK
jgi:hypothetical protein